MVTTDDRRRMLEDAWDEAPDGALTLREQLRANERAAGRAVSGGAIASISKNSSSHSYSQGGNGNITPTEVANVWRNLIDLFDGISDAYVAAGLAAEDVDIYPEMKRRLVPVREFTKDFTGVHCA